MSDTLAYSTLKGATLIKQGKVRDLYALNHDALLLVTTDRISAFDVILPSLIPDKGRVLNRLSNFWCHRFADLIPNHLIAEDPAPYLSAEDYLQVKGRSIVAKKTHPLPVEAIVRGYLIGSGWQDYQKTGQVCGITLPPGLKMAQKLETPIYTPSTKAEIGDHDLNIDFAETEKLLGKALADKVRSISLDLYCHARDYALQKGIIIADTKFEFGMDDQGNLLLIDEVLTPDSSRFWPVEHYNVGQSPPSFDKQYVRDYLTQLDWDKKPPAPVLPQEVIERTRAKYLEVERQLIVS